MMSNLIIGSIVLAIWCVNLFFGKSIGLSMILFTLPFTLFIFFILDKNKKIKNKQAKILIIPITLLSITYCIYNNIFFNSLNIFIIPILVIIMILELLDEKMNLDFDYSEKILCMIIVPLTFIGENFEKIRVIIEERLKINIDSRQNERTKKIIKSILITIPIVLIIIFLLSSADQIFGNIFIKVAEKALNVLSRIRISTFIIKLFLIIGVSIYFLNFFDYISSRYEKDDREKPKQNKDVFTIKMILSVLNIIYLVFCIIQIKSLFLKDVSINYANYARQGFFQLMIVSIINLVTILVAKRMEKDEEKKVKYIKVMCLLMILFTFIILLSSAYRMYLYESAYGYTMLRLLVYCSLFTESLLLIPTILYVIDKNIDLTGTYFIIVTVVYVCMNFANFENIIAKRNIDRYFETGKLDMYYLEYATGSDAVEEIVRVLDRIDEEGNRTHAERYLSELYNELQNNKMDFRDYNYSKSRAKKILEKNIEH